MSELKRCPFCGGEATAYYKWNYRKSVWFAYAQCTVCYAIGHSYATSEEPDDDDSEVWRDVANAWNMRSGA